MTAEDFRALCLAIYVGERGARVEREKCEEFLDRLENRALAALFKRNPKDHITDLAKANTFTSAEFDEIVNTLAESVAEGPE